MKWIILLVSVCVFSVLTEAQALPLKESVANSLHRAQLLYRQLNAIQPQLDFAPIWRRWHERRVHDTRVPLENLQLLINRLSEQQNQLTVCQQAAVDELTFQLALLQERNRLIEQLPHDAVEYSSSFYQLPNGRAWYKHWLKSWLRHDVSIKQLQTMAKKELQAVDVRREALDKLSLAKNHESYSIKDKSKIVSAFEQREKTVYQYLSTFVTGNFKAPKLRIEQSSLPKSFPAPGIYNPANQTFLYHLQTDLLPIAHMDWLLLHEAVPGHHYQSQFSLHQSNCSSLNGEVGANVFSEGWAAYVEQFGADLGLFTDKSSAAYALDWQALRAVRVLLDIGIHFYGWTDEQAEQEWMKHIPEQRAIMAREINRIRTWPVQVISYVYGKAVIEQIAQRMKANNPELSMAEVHRKILQLHTGVFTQKPSVYEQTD
ncbi:DUF885 family protein [Thalassotalea sediminis]|uniref:DUF885 family protein n=1 Tax=Thalassotalea sediminis TaxID=1759089 RepID=UPI002573FB8D|nr:DUF885 family protein [Thalassotalea sediminis]